MTHTTDYVCAIQERAVADTNAGPGGKGWSDSGVAYTLEARHHVQAVAFVQNTRDEVRLMGGDGQLVGALAAQPDAKQQCYIAFSCKDYGADATENLAPTMRAMGHDGSHANRRLRDRGNHTHTHSTRRTMVRVHPRTAPGAVFPRWLYP